MKRDDIWIVAGSKDYAGKPRPVIIVQNVSKNLLSISIVH